MLNLANPRLIAFLATNLSALVRRFRFSRAVALTIAVLLHGAPR